MKILLPWNHRQKTVRKRKSNNNSKKKIRAKKVKETEETLHLDNAVWQAAWIKRENGMKKCHTRTASQPMWRPNRENEKNDKRDRSEKRTRILKKWIAPPLNAIVVWGAACMCSSSSSIWWKHGRRTHFTTYWRIHYTIQCTKLPQIVLKLNFFVVVHCRLLCVCMCVFFIFKSKHTKRAKKKRTHRT